MILHKPLNLDAACSRPAISGDTHEEYLDSMITRLFACQGSAQLATALAAAAVEGDRSRRSDVLVVHDLASPAAQEQRFFNVIARAASGLHRWADIVQLPRDRDSRKAVNTISQALGTVAPSELWLNSFPTRGSDLLRGLYPAAKRVVYGDGIGVHFTPAYFLPDPPDRFRAACGTVVRWLRESQSGPTMVPAADRRVDEYRLLLPGLFDEPAPPHVRIEREAFLRLFETLGAMPETGIDDAVAQLRVASAAADRILLLLTSNYSETGRMSRHAEISGYLKMVREARPTPRTLVVVKPHPRDSLQKIDKLARTLGHSWAVLALNDSRTAHLPFEAVIARSIRDVPGLRSRLTALCVSSSCLSLEYLYGIRCVVGFGDPAAGGFARRWRRHRMQHETDLRRAIERIRAGEFGKVCV